MQGLYPLRHRGPARALVAGSFVTANGAAPTGVRGQGFTVARAGEGRWTVTLSEPVEAFDSIIASVAAEDLTQELYSVFVDEDSITTQAFEIRLLINADTSGAASALDDEPGARISFQAVVRLGNYAAS